MKTKEEKRKIDNNAPKCLICGGVLGFFDQKKGLFAHVACLKRLAEQEDIPNRITDKPLKWRTGPVPKKDRDGLYLVRTITPDYYLLGGHTINGSTRCDAWLPLSEILALVEE